MGKYCSKCGAPIEETSKFCEKCGALQELQEIEVNYSSKNTYDKTVSNKNRNLMKIFRNKKYEACTMGIIAVFIIVVTIGIVIGTRRTEGEIIRQKLINTLSIDSANVKIKTSGDSYNVELILDEEPLIYSKYKDNEYGIVKNKGYEYYGHSNKYYNDSISYYITNYAEMIRQIKLNNDYEEIPITIYYVGVYELYWGANLNVSIEEATDIFNKIITGDTKNITTSQEDFSKKNGTYTGTIDVKQLVQDFQDNGYIKLREDVNLSDFSNVKLIYTIETDKKYIIHIDFQLSIPNEDKIIFSMDIEDIGTIKREDSKALDLKAKCEKYAE